MLGFRVFGVPLGVDIALQTLPLLGGGSRAAVKRAKSATWIGVAFSRGLLSPEVTNLR